MEVKRRTKIANLYEWLDMNPIGFVPTLAVRADGKGWLVVMGLGDWLTLAREAIVEGRDK